jgi:cation transport protein ChaC
MWVFGYGSLIWDNWEKKYKCNKKIKATLFGYNRIFNKASVGNWGSKANPGPTLNIIKNDESFCEGVAFEFNDERKDKILSYLKKREGKNFQLKKFTIKTQQGDEATAFVPVYTGKNIIKGKTTYELAKMVATAIGTSGRCSDYIKNLSVKLEELEIEDKEVSSFIKIVQEIPTKC